MPQSCPSPLPPEWEKCNGSHWASDDSPYWQFMAVGVTFGLWFDTGDTPATLVCFQICWFLSGSGLVDSRWISDINKKKAWFQHSGEPTQQSPFFLCNVTWFILTTMLEKGFLKCGFPLTTQEWIIKITLCELYILSHTYNISRCWAFLYCDMRGNNYFDSEEKANYLRKINT